MIINDGQIITIVSGGKTLFIRKGSDDYKTISKLLSQNKTETEIIELLFPHEENGISILGDKVTYKNMQLFHPLSTEIKKRIELKQPIDAILNFLNLVFEHSQFGKETISSIFELISDNDHMSLSQNGYIYCYLNEDGKLTDDSGNFTELHPGELLSCLKNI